MNAQPDFEALKVEFSERSKPIVFWTGAGVSAPDMPSWSALRDELLRVGKDMAMGLRGPDQAAYMGELNAIRATSDLWIQFERMERRLGREPYERIIKAALGPSEKRPVPEVQHILW